MRAKAQRKYCGCSYLREFPIDVVKIDRSFTANAGTENGDLVLLKGIIDLGHALELNLVAEGIEASEQHTIVRQLGCHQAQVRERRIARSEVVEREHDAEVFDLLQRSGDAVVGREQRALGQLERRAGSASVPTSRARG